MDKYDPFISAKRQFDDLFSPNSPITSSTPLKKSQMEDSSTMSLKRSSSPTKSLNTTSSFRRTSSLRAPKKTQKPISYMPKYKPSIQRGISDEGPISTNFMKPEEYDELPVRSHAIIPPDLVPKSPAPIRLPTNIKITSPKVIKRSQNTGLNRRDLCLDLKLPNDFQLSKTDSLAAFLKYENDLNCLSSSSGGDSILNSPPKYTEKDLKDKSNSLNKQSTTINSFADLLDAKIDANDNTYDSNTNSIDDILSSTKFSFYNKLENDDNLTKNSNNDENINNENVNDNSHFGDTEQSIDTQLINSKDNLRISNLSKLVNDSVSSSSMESVETTRYIDLNDLNMCNSLSDPIDNDLKRNPKRQIQLRKNNLLFDSIDQNGNQIDHNENKNMTNMNITLKNPIKNDNDNSIETKNNKNNAIESLFDDFDLQEFISTFNDNEQFPIFKNFKDLNCVNEKQSNSLDGASSDECSTAEDKSITKKTAIENVYFNNDDEHHITQSSDNSIEINDKRSFDSPNALSSSNDQISATTPDVVKTESKLLLKHVTDTDDEKNDRNRKYLNDNNKLNGVDENGMSQTERELLESVHELNMMCDDSPIRLSTIDSNDDRISVDSYRYNTDSAYGR